MAVKFDLSGLERLQKNLKRINGSHDIPISELLTPQFMRGHTRFGSFEEMLSASPWKVETTEDFGAIPNAEWDAFIRRETRFSSWTEMQKLAANEWVKNELKR